LLARRNLKNALLTQPTINAITIVALGTSLPDLFASKSAALQERYADNSIGNVTGSNSVNVFLGLGLPWLIATIYWQVKEVRKAAREILVRVLFLLFPLFSCRKRLLSVVFFHCYLRVNGF